MPLLREAPAGGFLQEGGGVDSTGWALKGRDVGRGSKRGRRGNDTPKRGLVSYRRDRCDDAVGGYYYATDTMGARGV